MFGAIEILMIAIIFGIIYGRDAIDKTWNKRPEESVMESFAEDVKGYYEKDPKRLVQIIVGVGSAGLFIILGIYWVLTRTDILKMIGLEQ
tara:strand:- start:1220 stop:1489 length:270 start_codon:yes stop_codon:yes gene_type:complete